MEAVTPFKPLTKDAVADLLGISSRTVENWVNEGLLLPPKRLGGRVYWHPDLFFAWLNNRLASDDADGVGAHTNSPEQVAYHRKNDTATKSVDEVEQLRNRDKARTQRMLS